MKKEGSKEARKEQREEGKTKKKERHKGISYPQSSNLQVNIKEPLTSRLMSEKDKIHGHREGCLL